MERHLKAARVTPRISDHELDMAREPREESVLGWFWSLLGKKFLSQARTAAPMRSVAREAEESWPTRDP